MANFGIGYVDPQIGSNGNPGTYPTNPVRDIQTAETKGFDHIKVFSGTHDISAINRTLALEFYPGHHSWLNGLTFTKPCNLFFAGFRPPQRDDPDGAAYMTSPSPLTDYFKFTDGATPLDGTNLIQGLYFDDEKATRSAVYCTNLNGVVAENNFMVGSSWSNIPMFHWAPTVEANFVRLENNVTRYRPLLVVDNDSDAQMDGWVLRDNDLDGVAATDPLVYWGGSNGQSRGLFVVSNTFKGTTGACPAALYMSEPTNGLSFMMNSGDNLNGTNNLIARFDDLASGKIIHSLGGDADNGNIQINGQLYNQTTPNTGDDGRGGRDAYDGTNEVGIEIVGRY